MGYRSVVGIMFRREVPEAPSLPEVLALAKARGIIADKYFAERWNDGDYGWTDDHFIFYVEGVKWYESFEEVNAMEELHAFVWEMSSASNDQWYSGMFCRLGEQDDDVEQKFFGLNPWERMWVVRAIEFDGRDLLGNQKTEETNTP